jgi:hypothetical protein
VRDVEAVGAGAAGDVRHGQNLLQIAPRERHAQARPHARLLGATEPAEGGVVPAPKSAVLIVEGRQPVDADPDVGDPDRSQPPGHGGVDQHAVGRELRRDAELTSAGQQIEQIRPQQGLAAAEDHHRHSAVGQLVEEAQGLFAAQVRRGGLRHRGGVAVRTRHVAVHADVPHHHGCSLARSAEASGRLRVQLGARDAISRDLEQVAHRQHRDPLPEPGLPLADRSRSGSATSLAFGSLRGGRLSSRPLTPRD